jgi:hypothetical protein
VSLRVASVPGETTPGPGDSAPGESVMVLAPGVVELAGQDPFDRTRPSARSTSLVAGSVQEDSLGVDLLAQDTHLFRCWCRGLAGAHDVEVESGIVGDGFGGQAGVEAF